MLALYPLSKYLASFEFFNWLVMVKADGATKVVFDISFPKRKNFTHESVMRRFYSIVEPGPALAELPSRHGTENGLTAVASQLLPWFNSGRRFERLKSVKPPVACDYTVTIRHNRDGAPGRDSNQIAWKDFAREIGAVVIEDYSDEPIHLHDRFALYAGAKMNYGVCNGPVHTISLTPYPVTMVVNTIPARNSMTRWGMQPDQNYPWMLPNQRLVWEEDTLDNLMRMHERC